MSDLGSWDLFVLRHSKPANLALHFVSAVLFFGSPIYAIVAHDAWRWFVVFCLSGCIGTYAHHLTRDGTVSLHEATSSPRVVFYNVKMWWRVITGRYRRDVIAARAKLALGQCALGRTVVVTGASSGFGEAMVGAFLARGFRVVATVRRGRDAAQLVAASMEHGQRLQVLAVDLADPSDRKWLVSKLVALPRVDALVNNAGIGVFGALEDVPESELRAQMEVSFFAPALLARALAPRLREARGVIVNLSSPAGVTGFPFTAAYCASKHALEGLTESIRHELAGDVRVHLVTPSAHRTAFMKNARWCVDAQGPHAGPAQAYRAVMERSQEKPMPPARDVADLVADVVERDGYPFRLDVGANVRVLRAMVRWIPEWLWNALVTRVFARAAETHGGSAPARG